MKALRYLGIAAVAGALLVGETACNSMTNTGKGALIGGGGGAAVGAGIGAQVGVDEVIAQVLPEEKERSLFLNTERKQLLSMLRMRLTLFMREL